MVARRDELGEAGAGGRLSPAPFDGGRAAAVLREEALTEDGVIDGAIAMGFGWALTENMVHDGEGAMVNPALRNYDEDQVVPDHIDIYVPLPDDAKLSLPGFALA